tara:strand:+ start:2045 stop:2557 length:513 start_codon:yes stop_codon:yes gene_type:complete
MNQNTETKFEFKNNLFLFFKRNRRKLLFITLVFLLIPFIVIMKDIYQDKKNKIVSEKYIQAGLYLSLKENEKSKKLLEEIIEDENKIYSILAINKILEKNLVSDKSKILTLFKKVENTIKSKEHMDLLIFKKALFLLKNSENNEGNKILKSLINSNSKFKSIAEEVLEKQ